MKKFNRFSKIITLMVAIVTVMFACVEDDYDTPDVPQIPIGTVYTIQQVKDSLGTAANYQFKNDASVYATVTMDNETDNSYRTFFIQDATAGIAVYQDVSGGVYIGDSVRIYLKDLIVMKYSGLFQINSITGAGVNVDDNVIKQGANHKRVPEEATIAQILADNVSKAYYQGRLVKIVDAQFIDADTSKTFANSETLETENRMLQDTSDNQLIVRTSGYSTFASKNIPDGRGSLIAIVSQYNSDMQLSIRRFSEVEMNNERFDINTGGGGGTVDGEGSFNTPYNVAGGIENQGLTGVWVEGYIVGVYETLDASGNNLADYTPSFTAPFYTNANIIIADSETETDIANCVIVQLLAGDIRTTLNLVDNVANKTKQVKVYGDLTAYFGDEGLKNTSGYWFEGAGIIPATGFFEEDFSTSLGGFIQYSITGPSQVWAYSSSYKCATMTGYSSGSRIANNDWLISPAIDLTGKSNVTLNFTHAIGYGNYSTISDELKVFVSEDYSGTGDPTAATWVELTFAMPADLSTNFAWTNSGDISLSSYDGKSGVYFAFNYNCGTVNASTWEIKDVVVSEAAK